MVEKNPMLTYTATHDKPIVWQPQNWLSTERHRELAAYLVDLGVRSSVTAPLEGKKDSVTAITAMSRCLEKVAEDRATAVYVIKQTATFRADALGLIEHKVD